MKTLGLDMGTTEAVRKGQAHGQFVDFVKGQSGDDKLMLALPDQTFARGKLFFLGNDDWTPG